MIVDIVSHKVAAWYVYDFETCEHAVNAFGAHGYDLRNALINR